MRYALLLVLAAGCAAERPAGERPPTASTSLVVEDADGGVRVVSVEGFAGLRAGDILCAINDWPVSDRRSFENGLRRLGGTTAFTLGINRDGVRSQVAVKQ